MGRGMAAASPPKPKKTESVPSPRDRENEILLLSEAVDQLYYAHDALEDLLIERTASDRFHPDLPGLWLIHDALERAIILVEAALPPEVAERLREGGTEKQEET